MHPQLACVEDPEVRTLVALSGAGPFEALCTLNALHTGAPADVVGLRAHGVTAGDKVFPHPTDVPALLACTLQRLNELFGACHTPLDDLHVAVFAIFCVLEVHPFDNGNGRTALSFAQYLLMQRWSAPRPVLGLHKDAHREFGHILRGLGQDCDGESADSLESMTLYYAGLLAGATVERLHTLEPVHQLATALAETIG